MMSKPLFPKRGEIYWIDFNELEGDNKPSGTEINGKERPALIISVDWYNEDYKRIAILPMSSR